MAHIKTALDYAVTYREFLILMSKLEKIERQIEELKPAQCNCEENVDKGVMVKRLI